MAALSPACTQAEAQDNDNRVAGKLAAMRAAMGGEHWTAVRSLHVVADVRSGGQDARGDRWEDLSTGRYLDREDRPLHPSQDGFDGITSWHQGRSGIAYTLGDVNAGLVAADEAFRVARGWWFPDRHPATIALAGVMQEGGRSFDVMDVTPEGGRLFEAWIDRSTHLLARTVEQQAEDRVVTTYSDYRMADGLLMPFTIRTGDGADAAYDEVRTVRSIDVDPIVPDSLYGIPKVPPPDIELPPQRDSVDVSFRLTADNRIMVPLTLNGTRTMEAEFDSGGSLILQPATLAAMRLAAVGRSKQMGGGEGATTSTNGRIDTVAIGEARVRGLGFHSFAFAPDQPDKALVGQEILQRFVVRFDFDRQVMTLTRPDAFTYRGGGAMLPFHFQDNQPEVKGSIDGVAGLFTIDTGDGGSLLLIAPFARQYRLIERYRADLPYDGNAVSATHGVWARTRAGTVAFDGPDGRTLVDVHTPVTRISLQRSGFDANRNVSANIGLGILKQFNLTFDYARQRIFVEPNHRYGQPDVFNRAGLRLKRDGDGWSVTAVYPGTPAAEAGIKQRDVVSRIDGETAAQLSVEGLAGKLLAPVGTKLGVTVHASGGDRQVNLILRDLL